MTGTVTEVHAWTQSSTLNLSVAPVAVGDRIAWMLQYDRATPVVQSTTMQGTTYNIYSLAGPLMTHVVDQTKGTSLYTAALGSIPAGHTPPQLSSNPNSSLTLENGSNRGNVVFHGNFLFEDHPPGSATPYYASLFLSNSRPLPTMNLARLQLDQLPIERNSPFSQFFYGGKIPGRDAGFDFYTRLNSLSPSASIQSVPEPSSLALLAGGFAGLAVRRLRPSRKRAN